MNVLYKYLTYTDAIYVYDDILQTTNARIYIRRQFVTRSHAHTNGVRTHTLRTYNDIKSPHIMDGRRKSHRARYNNMQNTHPHDRVIMVRAVRTV